MSMDYTYAKYVGIVDLVLLLLLIIFVIIGFKKGFLLKTISIANWVFGLLFAVLFCVRFANDVLYNWFGQAIHDNFYNNIMANPKFNEITTTENGIDILKNLGIPGFIAQIVCNNASGTDIAASVANNLANFTTSIVLVVISFLILFFGTTLLCLLLKLLANILRTSKFVRVIDGILGVVLYFILYYIAIQLIFFILIIIYHKAGLQGYNTFVDFDIRGIDASFRVSRWLFDNNFLANLIGLLF